MLSTLDTLMSDVKTKFGVTPEEWSELGKLTYSGPKVDISSLKSINKNLTQNCSSWVLQTDKDLSLL